MGLEFNYGSEFDYAVSFEAVDTAAPQIYLRGELEFHSLGLPLANRIREILKPFEQKFIPRVQTGVRPLPRKLWKINKDGIRTPIDLPSEISKEDKEWEEKKRISWNSIPVGDPSSPF